MKQADDRHIARLLRRSAAQFPYPPTPDVRADVRAAIRLQTRPPRQAPSSPRPRLRLAPLSLALAILLSVVSLLLVPQVRASVLQLLRAGGITIFITEPTPTAASQGILDATPAAVRPPTATPRSPASAPTTAATSTSFDTGTVDLLVPATPVSLAHAAAALQESGPLPSSMPPFGAPQDVFVDDEAAPRVAILVWDAEDGRQLALYAIAGTGFAYKMADDVVTTTVRGSQAFWVDGLHRFILRDGEFLTWETVRGSVLIWTEGDLTYRLEGAASLEEARTLAGSLE